MNVYESAPLEIFLLERVKNSVHASHQLLWALENYLNDTKNLNRNSKNYLRIARILIEVQKASFKHEISDSTFQNTKRTLIRAKEHLETFYGGVIKKPLNQFLCTGPPIVAFGMMLGALGCPEMVRAMRPLITMQTKKSDPFEYLRGHVSNKMRVTPILQTGNIQASSPPSSCRMNYSEVTLSSEQSDSSGPSLEELSRGKAFSLKRYISKTAKTLLNSKTSSAKTPNNPLVSNEMTEEPPVSLFPAIPFYYNGDMQFISSLIAVSNRLATLKRASRLKALHAELCLINHNLPAPICTHTWCSEAQTGHHHRILSILPYESSILNSAERVPFIIFIEILNGCSDEDFNNLVLENLENRKDQGNIDFDSSLSTVESENKNIINSSNILDTLNDKSTIDFDLNILTNNEADVTSATSTASNNSDEKSRDHNSNYIATAHGIVDISERMRTAAVMLAQLARQSQIPNADLNSINAIRSRIIYEMETLEKDRLIDALQQTNERKKSADFYDDQIVSVNENGTCENTDITGITSVTSVTGATSVTGVTDSINTENNKIIQKGINLKLQDPSALIFQEEWEIRKARLARASIYSKLPGWDVFSVIVKSSTDMRQEFFAFQLVREFQKIFKLSELEIFLRPCKVLVAGNGGGLIETVPNAISVHSIKKGILMSLGKTEFTPEELSLKGHFINKFGGSMESSSYKEAIDNFICSLAGYSLLTYILQIRDRHNGNILLDRNGNIIHIDFGFMLSNSPGYVGFESAPFKLTADYLDLLEGVGSENWKKFKELLTQGLLALRKHSDRLLSILEVLLPNSNLPCFYAGEAALLNFKERLHLSLTDQQIVVLIDRLMTTSTLNVFTRLYDNYQYYTNGIL